MADLERSPEAAIADDVAELAGVAGEAFQRRLAKLRRIGEEGDNAWSWCLER
jgi:hypothetical protein